MRQGAQLVVAREPHPERQSEPVLPLRDDRVRQEAAQCFLEERPQLQSTDLGRCRQPEREIDDLVGQEREPDSHSGKRGSAPDLGEVVVGKRVLPVVLQHPVHQRRPGTGSVRLALRSFRTGGIDRREEIRLEHLGDPEPREKVVGLHSLRHRQPGLPHVARDLPEQRQTVHERRAEEDRFDDAAPQCLRDHRVQREELLLRIACVSAEQLVAAVARRGASSHHSRVRGARSSRSARPTNSRRADRSVPPPPGSPARGSRASDSARGVASRNDAAAIRAYLISS